jgi:polyisoprenoid-binding protein YceI
MKKNLLGTLAFVSFALISSQSYAADLKAGTYKVDASHSKVGFEISHLVISTVEGKFSNYDGAIHVADSFDKSDVTAKVELKSIDTGVKQRDEHLRGADFFNVVKYPTMTFKSTSISGSPESFQMTGDLTIKGVTKKVTFDGKYNGSATDPYGNFRAGFSAKAKINRQDFGLTWSKTVEAGPVVGDEVTLDLKLEAIQDKPKTK